MFYSLAWQLSRFSACLFIGMRRVGGCLKRYASTAMKGRGRRTPETATTEGCSFYGVPGSVWGDTYVPIWLPPESRSTGHGASTSETVAPGANGGRREDAA